MDNTLVYKSLNAQTKSRLHNVQRKHPKVKQIIKYINYWNVINVNKIPQAPEGDVKDNNMTPGP